MIFFLRDDNFPEQQYLQTSFINILALFSPANPIYEHNERSVDRMKHLRYLFSVKNTVNYETAKISETLELVLKI